jgi:YidC/Oxa1 family membrane protein insertase
MLSKRLNPHTAPKKAMDNNNLIVAVILSVAILVGFQLLYVKPHQEQYRQQVLAQKVELAKNGAALPDTATVMRDRAEIVRENPRVAINTPQLRGSINLKGARFDDLSLVQYRQTVADESPNVVLLSPAGSAEPNNAYYVDDSWLGDDGVAVPNSQTVWKAEGGELSQAHPVTLTWDNGQGLQFQRTISVDDHFMFTIADHVVNKGGAAVTLYPFGAVARQGNPVVKSSSVLHEGPLGVVDGTLEEYKYKKLIEDGKKIVQSKGGWLGITDKYWLVAMVPPQDDSLTAEFAYSGAGQTDPNQGFFQSDFRGAPVKIAAGTSVDRKTLLFAGAKRVRLLDSYATQLDIPHFDRAIDFGWFYFLTKPFLYLLEFLGQWFGSFGIAILVFTVGLKLITLPLSLKSYHSMSRMKALQPEMKRIQERFADDKPRQSSEMMELYKREKVSPVSGCLPTLIQIPIFFALYKVLYVGIELRQAPFFGWIHDMSVADPTSVFTAFGLAPWNLPAAMHIGAWPILMGCSMFAQQKLSPQPPDKAQANMFMVMPIVFTYMLAQMPAGLVIYWTWSNLLSIAQQWFIMSRDAKRKAIKV